MKTKTRNCSHWTCPPQGPCRRPPTPKKANNRIRQYSTKRQKENRIYSALRKLFLSDNPNCQGLLDSCAGQATQVHHMRGRVGANFLDMTVMTEDEKAVNRGWKAADGYVKDIPFKEAFQNAWHNWSEETRDAFRSLPNFEASVFEEITGVKS